MCRVKKAKSLWKGKNATKKGCGKSPQNSLTGGTCAWRRGKAFTSRANCLRGRIPEARGTSGYRARVVFKLNWAFFVIAVSVIYN